MVDWATTATPNAFCFPELTMSRSPVFIPILLTATLACLPGRDDAIDRSASAGPPHAVAAGDSVAMQHICGNEFRVRNYDATSYSANWLVRGTLDSW